jgi:glyoxylase-like metal-dependent hydrolase (beta-lactamase superfamily II)
MIDQRLIVGPFQCNCRVLVCPETGEGLVVDPGDEAPKILAAVRKAETASGKPVRIKYLLHTHGHLDHIAASKEVKRELEAALGGEAKPRLALHRADEPLYLSLKTQSRLFGLSYDDPSPIDHFLEEGEELSVGKMKLSVIHTPGHSPGSVCFRLKDDSSIGAKETLFSGDTLFKRSVGRTDLWGGDQEVMFKSIKDRIFALDGDTLVCPGHGPDTRVGEEKRENPFVQG